MSAPTDAVISAAFTPAAAPRRVLIYAPLAYSTPHFETDLEIAQRHLDLGDNVELVLCDAELPSCQLNPTHEPVRCAQCVSRNHQGAAQLSARVPVRGLLTLLTADDHDALGRLPRTFSDTAGLRRFRFETFDAGLATLSSLIDFVRSPQPDIKRHAELIHGLLHGAVLSYLAMKRILSAQLYDRVYIYNGRWSMVRSAVRACEAAGVPYYTHERGSDCKKFALYRDVLPHDKPDFKRQVQLASAVLESQPEASAIAEQFFHERRQRVEKNWFSYTKAQEQGRVPVDWSRPVRRIIFFTSSEFEYAAIGEGTSGRIYPSQQQGTRRIAQHLARHDPGAHLWVRVHPNDSGPQTSQLWTDIASALTNVTVVLPDEKIDSYAMLEGADLILTFGSTVGLEATFWGRPAVCADHSFYDGHDAHYEAQDEAELFRLITTRSLPPKPRAHALRFGYYLNTFGSEFLHFATDKISDYEFQSPFRGHCLKPDHADLRKRLVELYNSGDLQRAEAIARLCANYQPEDTTAHVLLVLSAIRQSRLAIAVTALETAAHRLPAVQLEPLLKHTAKPLLDATQALAKSGPAEEFRSYARRIGSVFARVPAYAAVGHNQLALAERARPGVAPETTAAR